jgi:hypothetical protein
MMFKNASCFVLACSVVLGGCVGDDTAVDPIESEDALEPKADANGAWTKVADGVWERTWPNKTLEQYVAGPAGLSWKVQQQQEELEAFLEEVGSSSAEGLSEGQQKVLKVLQENLDATEKALVKLSLPEPMEDSAPGLNPQYYTSSAWLGSCTDFLVAGPTSGSGAYAYSSIDSACPSFYLSAYVTANDVGGGISTTFHRGISASVGGTYNCTSQAYAQANGWGHTLTYPYCY